MTMAVGLIIHGDQAEAILQDKKADLVAVGREFIHNPNWAMDAAQKLGVDPDLQRGPAANGLLARKAGPPRLWRKSLHVAKGHRCG